MIPRIALRKNLQGYLDDIVVEPVTMFRAEILDTDSMWLCCYLSGDDWRQRITWLVTIDNGKLRVEVVEMPERWEDWDEKNSRSLTDSPA